MSSEEEDYSDDYDRGSGSEHMKQSIAKQARDYPVTPGICLVCGDLAEAKEIIQEFYDHHFISNAHHEDLYWKVREFLGLRICSERNCTGDGLVSNGYGDEYFCDCMTQTERYAHNECSEE